MSHTHPYALGGIPVADVRHWMFEQALPLWANAGVDRLNGGYVEELDFRGVDAGVGFKRTRVTCRQIYVFSHAAVLGWPSGQKLAEHGFEFLLTSWAGPAGGWPRTVDRRGKVLDATPDLYDLAFVMFALGWYVRATGDVEAALMARQTLDFIKAHMRPLDGEGFLNEKPAKGWRLQNPHMHLLEAMLACYEATGEDRYATLAIELSGLFHRRFLDQKSATLAEYYTDEWERAPGGIGKIIEPGHQFEWAWILGNLNRLLGADTADAVRALTGFAERFGVDHASGATYNQVRDDGAPIDRGSRTWPNTERVKGGLALKTMFGEDSSGMIIQSLRLLLDRYLAVETPGLWVDRFDSDGRPQSSTVPASTLYHVFLAFAEVLRE